VTSIEQLQGAGIHRAGSPKTGFRVGAGKRELDRPEELKIASVHGDAMLFD
jgi:hypothetical protein